LLFFFFFFFFQLRWFLSLYAKTGDLAGRCRTQLRCDVHPDMPVAP
jgi:hypothetical protein